MNAAIGELALREAMTQIATSLAKCMDQLLRLSSGRPACCESVSKTHVDVFTSADVGHARKLVEDCRASVMAVFARNTICLLSPAEFGATTETMLDKMLFGLLAGGRPVALIAVGGAGTSRSVVALPGNFQGRSDDASQTFDTAWRRTGGSPPGCTRRSDVVDPEYVRRSCLLPNSGFPIGSRGRCRRCVVQTKSHLTVFMAVAESWCHGQSEVLIRSVGLNCLAVVFLTRSTDCQPNRFRLVATFDHPPWSDDSVA